jgi:hypothetical protein
MRRQILEPNARTLELADERRILDHRRQHHDFWLFTRAEQPPEQPGAQHVSGRAAVRNRDEDNRSVRHHASCKAPTPLG